MSRSSFLFLFLVCLLTVAESFGQSATSPFSTFGIGEQYGNALVNNQGMGGIGVAVPQYWFINNQNPANLIYNRLTVFNAGVALEQRTISADTLSETAKGGNLNYIATAFPIKRNRWSTSFAISPYTSVKYNLKSFSTVPNSTERFENFETGSGGITQLSWSNGVSIARGVAVGIRANYLFGSILNVYQNRSMDSQQPLNYYATVEERSYAKDFTFSAGISLSKDSLFSRKKYRLNFGAVYDFASDVNTKRRTLVYRSNTQGTNGQKDDVDTLDVYRGYFSLPAGLTAGVSLGRDKWIIGTEFSYYDWSTFRSVSADDEGLKEAWKVSVGGEITPDSYSENFLKRITYRAGLSFEELPYLANNNVVNDLGMTVGLSVPAGRSSLDLAFRYGQRGNKSNNLIEEDYFRVSFGISFNDQWFIRRRFD